MANGRLRRSSASKIANDPLQQAGDELASRYALIEEAWKSAEAKLAKARVPVDVKLLVRTGVIESGWTAIGDEKTYLAYMKLNGKWRVCVITDTTHHVPEFEDEYVVKPIIDCPLETRLGMMELFPKLVEEIIKINRDLIPKIEETVAKFEAELEAMGLEKDMSTVSTAQHDFSSLREGIPAAIEEMPDVFPAHRLILKLAEENQQAYVDALHSYRNGKPFQAVHTQLAMLLNEFPELVQRDGDDTKSVDIWGHQQTCSRWRKVNGKQAD